VEFDNDHGICLECLPPPEVCPVSPVPSSLHSSSRQSPIGNCIAGSAPFSRGHALPIHSERPTTKKRLIKTGPQGIRVRDDSELPPRVSFGKTGEQSSRQLRGKRRPKSSLAFIDIETVL
jgi:hypothetical protein